MFGKAVKIRHCPATVSATGELFVFSTGELPGIRPDATGKSPSNEMPGKAVRKGASQETGPWCHLLGLRSEGNGGYRCLLILAGLA
jgi:hypothetical protein